MRRAHTSWKTYVVFIGGMLVGGLAGPGAAMAGHPPLTEAGAVRSPNMSLIASVMACDHVPKSPMEHHGGDIAFWGNTAVLACSGDDDQVTDDGFAVVSIGDPAHPTVVSRFPCVASASDIAIWDDLVFLAVDTNNESTTDGVSPGPTETECDALPTSFTPGVDETNRFAGVRVIDIADSANPRQLAAVHTNVTTLDSGSRRVRGAHGLTVVPDLAEGRLLIYAAAYGQPTVDIVEVQLNEPESAHVLRATPNSDHKFNTGRAGEASGCHDIAVFLPRNLAACTSPPNLEGRGTSTVLFDIEDLDNPKMLGRTPAVSEAGRRRDHSATFSWDGNTMVVTDENLGGFGTNECKDRAGPDQGVLWFYDVTNPRAPELLSSQPPHPVAGVEWCHPKQHNVVPLPSGDDVLVTSWVGGGTTVVDFTNPRNPVEVAHYVLPRDGFPLERRDNATVAWSSYWYNGHVYANNLFGCLGICGGTKTRGLDVFALDFSVASNPSDPGRRLDEPFAGAIELPFHNSYFQDCLPEPFGAAHGTGAAAAACSGNR